MSEEELLDTMCQTYWKAGPGIRNSMRSILELLHAHGYRRCAEGQRVTQWCDRAEKAEAEVERLKEKLFSLGAMDDPPCFACGYNGGGYYQPGKHPCAARHLAARGES